MREKKSTEYGTNGKRKRWSAAEKLRIVLLGIIRWYNHERLHSSLGFLRPADYYCGEGA